MHSCYVTAIMPTEFCYLTIESSLDQAKLIASFPFPPMWIFDNALKFHYNGNYNHMNF